MARNPRTGGTLEDYFTEKGELEEVHEIAMRRMLAVELGKFIKARGWTRVRLANELRTSRPQVDRLLDPNPARASRPRPWRAPRRLSASARSCWDAWRGRR